METTPNDLRQQQFEIKFRGYNPDDVEVFRDLAATALEEARAELLKLTEENNHLNDRLKHLVALEETLKSAILESQKNADTTVANARKEAEVTIQQAKKEAALIIREAEHEREKIVADLNRQMGRLVADINKIRFIRTNYLVQLKAMITTHLASVDQSLADVMQEEKQSGKESSPTAEMPAQPVPEPPPSESAPTGEGSPPAVDPDWQDLKKHLDEG